MKNKVLMILGFTFVASAFSAVETSLGVVKAVKISQKVEVADCQTNYVRKESMAWCKVPVITLKDTDTIVAMSPSIHKKIPQGNGVILDITLTANTEGFYWFVFSRKNADGFYQAAPTYDEVSPLLGSLVDELDNGEVHWKLYRVQAAN